MDPCLGVIVVDVNITRCMTVRCSEVYGSVSPIERLQAPARAAPALSIAYPFDATSSNVSKTID